jgi:hypothetical protein
MKGLASQPLIKKLRQGFFFSDSKQARCAKTQRTGASTAGQLHFLAEGAFVKAVSA